MSALPSAAARQTNPDDEDAQRAIELYFERGVIVPGYAGEIAEARRLLHAWADAGEALR